ncbi:hypothetical protein ACUYOF_20315 [Photobacterium ganghwense]|uniref:hypothetical protein n=1 Tax=Photobacterium ganghwense TaxID=320778 RepID=UPI004056DA33
MNFKRTWGYISLLLGLVSLMCGGVAFAGLLGSSHVIVEVGDVMMKGGADALEQVSPEQTVAEMKSKYQMIVSAGGILFFVGAWMMRDQWD